MVAKSKEYLTREQVEKIVENKNRELYNCFNKLLEKVGGVETEVAGVTKSQERIERALLGDEDFDDIGMAKMVNVAYTHARQVDESEIMPKMKKIITFWDRWQDSGMWKLLEKMVDNYKVLKVITALILGSGFISLANIIKMVLDLLNKLSSQ